MIAIATASFVVGKGLMHILKELYSGRRIVVVNSAMELKALLDQNKISLLIASAAILNEIKPLAPKNIQIVRLMDSRPSYLDLDYNNSELLYSDDDESQVLHTLKRNLALMDKTNTANKSESELSDRELDIVREVALGKTNKEIADKLYISTHTVITHRKNITRKLGIKTVSGLTVYALLNKLIKMGDSF